MTEFSEAVARTIEFRKNQTRREGYINGWRDCLERMMEIAQSYGIKEHLLLLDIINSGELPAEIHNDIFNRLRNYEKEQGL